MNTSKKNKKTFKFKTPFKINFIERISKKINKRKKNIKALKKEINNLRKKNSILENKIESNQAELTSYINQMFEKQEKERVLGSIVNNIRETLDLNLVLEKAAYEITKLLKLRRTAICIYNEENNIFKVSIEYIASYDAFPEIKGYIKKFELDKNTQEKLFDKQENIYSNTNNLPVPKHIKDVFNIIKLKNYIAIPLIYKEKKLGLLFVSGDNITFSKNEIDILEDFAIQVTSAIHHAKLYKEAQKHIKLKNEFISTVSHEIRTPINAIIGFSDILQVNSENLTEKQLSYLKNISTGGKHLLDIINNILDLSKVESGNYNLSYVSFSTETIIKEVIMMLENMALKKSINIFIELHNKDITADPKLFRQILYNLINNAIKFTRKNGNIKIKSYMKKNYFYVEVEDDGIGIKKEDYSKIFEQFTQGDSSYTKRQEGTGLGLTLAKKFITLQNGKIEFESTKDVGSKFWFYLPVKPTILENDKQPEKLTV